MLLPLAEIPLMEETGEHVVVSLLVCFIFSVYLKIDDEADRLSVA